MSTRFLTSFKAWDETYGKLITWGWRLFLYPALFVAFYAGKSYLDVNYVSKTHFDKAMTTLSVEKERIAADQKLDLREINGKLDTLIETRAVNTERINQSERRISRLEEKADRFKSE